MPEEHIEQLNWINSIRPLSLHPNIDRERNYFRAIIEEKEFKRNLFSRLFPIFEEEGFYMNQKIGNCYLIATINAIRLNPYFMEELYKSLSFTKEGNVFKTKVSYSFPDWEKVIVSIKDLKKQKQNFSIKNLSPELLDELVWKILMKIEKNIDIEELISSWYAKYDFDSRWKKRVIFSNSFIEILKDQIIWWEWEYYKFLEKEDYPSVDANLWYKILEALYTAKKWYSQERKSMVGWSSKNVLVDFLWHRNWNFHNYLLINTLEFQELFKIFDDFSENRNNYIITAIITLGKTPLNITPYFEYNWYKMSDWHAYSIVWFDRGKDQLHIVNPWNNNEILYFPLQDFFKLFSSVFVAKRKDS